MTSDKYMISQRSPIPDQADVSAWLGMIGKLEMLLFKYSNQKKWTRRGAFSTAKTQYRKFETNIPRKGIARPQSQSQFPYSCALSDLYIPTIGLPILLQENMWIPVEKRSKTHECGIWD